jgi:regulator of RNase E activity RraB
VGEPTGLRVAAISGHLISVRKGLQRVLNGNVLEALRSEGDTLTASRDVMPWAHLKDDEDRARFRSAVTLLGYRIASESEDREDEYPKGICIVRLQSVHRAELDEAVVELYRIARKFHGSYDGWECQVV